MTLRSNAAKAIATLVVAGQSFLVCSAVTGSEPRYAVTDLGTLGGELANALGINEHNEAVGRAEDEMLAARHVLWSNGTAIAVPGLNPWHSGVTYGVNNHGHVVGSSMAPSKQFPGTWVGVAFYWSPELGPINLSPESDFSDAHAINDSGQVVGRVGGDAVIWTVHADGLVDHSSIPPADPAGASREAHDINQSGTVVGTGRNAEWSPRAWVWQPGWSSAQELEHLGGYNSFAYGINEAGVVVGSSQPPNQPAQPVMWIDGELIELGLIDRPEINMGRARAINNHGQIVGSDNSSVPGVDAVTPWIWEDGVKYDLNDLISEADREEWRLTWPMDINDQGSIVGIGIRWIDGVEYPGRAFLLTLIPDSVPGDLNGDGVVDVFDLLILLSAWGPCGDPSNCGADLNGDSVVDVFDLLILLGNWG